jgi:hypothetical protein
MTRNNLLDLRSLVRPASVHLFLSEALLSRRPTNELKGKNKEDHVIVTCERHS